MKHDTHKRLTACVLTLGMVLGLCPAALAEEAGEGLQETAEAVSGWLSAPDGVDVAADWKFGKQFTNGSIAGGDLVIEDQSGNNNDLEMQLYQNGQPTEDTGAADWEAYLSFSEDSMTGEGGSLVFNGDDGAVDKASRTGADFITGESAPINDEEFENGYTMEFLYYFPEDWTAADEWMSLIGRQGSSGGNPEGEQGTMYTSISNCKEIQFITGNKDGSHKMSSAAWSVSMDEGGVWYHIAIVSDGREIATYINGCEAFRDYVSDEMAGMYADPDDGRFRIGSSWWNGLDKFLQGSLQEIRISRAPLEKEDWLVPNPEDYVDSFGSNDPYQLKNEDNYNIVLLPDTQNCVEFCGEEGGVMDTAIDELIDTADDLNVIGVVGLGDIVDDNNAAQYQTAKRIFYQLPKAGIRTLLQPGNHDGWASSDSYSQTFGAGSEWAERLANGYLTTYDWSGAMFLQGGDRVYMVLSLANEGGKTSWNPNNQELEWFKSMLEQYQNIPTIVTTHDVQNCSDTEPSAIKLSKQGQKLWDLVKGYDQVFMMVGGHSHGSGVEILKNDNQKDVISILTDFQFSYNGGNGWFRYLEFDESANKIYYSVYSPYAASLDEGEKSFFDVNFLTGAGNEGEIDWNFEERFAGLDKAPQAETGAQGKWMSGEYHTHTGQSKDATEAFMSLENVLGAAFRNEKVLDGNKGTATKTDNITAGDSFDYLMLADHLRKSYNGVDENASRQYNVPFYVAAQTQLREMEKLRMQGLYADKILYSGFEWDMPGLDHASVGLIDPDSDAVPAQGIHQFEWLYGSQKDGDDTALFDGDSIDEQALWGERKNPDGSSGSVDTAVEAAEWVEQNYPDSFILPNHPSRHNGDTGEVTIEALRKLNDAAPGVVFGFEGLPGNQMDDSCELPDSDIRGGADEMIAVTGGVWDALLSEGRRFYNFANSDFHFKISSNEQYSSGYWASEFSNNYTWVEPGNDGQFTFSDVVEGMRSGNSYAVKGNLISDLSFTVSDGSGAATMGGELTAKDGDPVTVTIRFKVPEKNNYQSLYNTSTGLGADNSPEVDHVDLIMGHVTGKVDGANYSSTDNTDAKIVKTFSKAELAAAKGVDGFYTLTYTTEADSDLYFRVRGVSFSDVDGNGDPVTHERSIPSVSTQEKFDYINDYNYTHLSFYANPVWVTVSETGDTPETPEAQTSGMENGSASLDLTKIAGYSAGQFDVDGGVMEIVAYNSANGYAYAVNGKSGKLAVIPMGELKNTGVVTVLTGVSFDVKAAVQAKDSSFTYGDMTSVAVSPDGKTLAAALQAEGYADAGRVALFTCAENGSLTLDKVVTVGVQPDMVTFADNNTVLTADEGEPRQGYSTTDPKGSVSVVDVKAGTADVVDFTAFDAQRDSLVLAGIVLKKNTDPSVDLEPEYIAVANGRAYVTLQEANAIAVLDIASRTFTGVYSAGFEDHSKTPVDIDKKDEQYAPKTYESLMGIRMPDGIAAFEQNGRTYLLTANEGDSREWGDYLNEKEVNFKKSETSPTGAITADNSGLTGKVVFFDTTGYDGLDSQKDYLFGGRSFTLYEVSGNGIREVFTSGSDFERLTAQYLPAYFNCSNDDKSLDDRSGKKGPEAESVAVGQVNGRTYAFVALERIGGVMVYDITDPARVSYVNYINSRDFAATVPGSENDDKLVTGGDVAPEGLAFVSDSVSPTGKPLLLAACEVSGTLAVYELTGTQSGNGGGGSGSGGSSSSGSGSSGTSGVTGSGDDVSISAGGSVTSAQMDKAVDRADRGGAITVDAGRNDTLSLPVSGLESAADNDNSLTVKLLYGEVTLPPEILASVAEQAGRTAVITVKPVDKNDLNTRQQAAVGSALVFDLIIKSGDTVITDFGSAAVTVSLPYELPVGQDPAGVVAWFLDDDGSITPCETRYDVPGKTVIFTTQHFSKYVIGYVEPVDFTDVAENAYYYDAVKWAVEQGITAGTSEDTFSPDATCTRAQMVTFLWRVNGSPKASGTNPFADVSADAYYYDAVLWAVEQGITSGTSATAFSPDAVLTRSQAVTFLWRANGTPVVNDAMDFADVDGSAYYGEAVRWAVSEGVTSGTGSDRFSPDDDCTRAQIVTFLYRDAQ